MGKVVAFGRYLQGATRVEGTFDFSLAFAVIEWIEQAVNVRRPTSDVFADVSRGVARVKEVVSLSTGIGLIDIWRSMWPRRAAKLNGEQVSELENADRRLCGAVLNTSELISLADVKLVLKLSRTTGANARFDVVVDAVQRPRRRQGQASRADCTGSAGKPLFRSIYRTRYTEMLIVPAQHLSEVSDSQQPVPPEMDLLHICVRLRALYAISTNHTTSRPVRSRFSDQCRIQLTYV